VIHNFIIPTSTEAVSLTETQKTSDITTLDQQLESLDKQAYEVHEEIRRLIEKRDKLNDQFKRLREETCALRAERDSVNEKVHALKTQRDETRATIHPVIEEIKAAREKIIELKKKLPKRSRTDIQQEFDDIEWKIQTTSLDLKEERQLIEKVKQLEIQLDAYKKIDQQTKRIVELDQGLKAVDETIEKLHKELSAFAKESQELHQKMVAKIEEAKRVKEEAGKIHSSYLLSREKAGQREEELRRLAGEKRKIRDLERQTQETQRQQDAATQKAAEKALREKLEVQAREKLQKGKKITWDEFQLLAEEDGSETQG
jgi:uncharacterized coiled-coil DUF342 family protein